MMKKVALMGFGKQGIKAVSSVSSENMSFRRFYVDRDRDAFEEYLTGGWKLNVGFGWVPEAEGCCYLLKDWLLDNRDKVLRFFDNFSMVILCMGLGGSTAEDAIEMAHFLKENRPDIITYIVCSQPFRRETDYRHNVLARREIQLIKSYDLAWTLVENEKVYLENEKIFSQAYEISHRYLADIIEHILDMPGSGLWNSGMEISELREYFPKGMVHITDVEKKETRSVSKTDLRSTFLPYDIDWNADKILIAVQISEGISIVDLADIIDGAVNCFDGKCEYVFRVYPGYPVPGQYRMTMLAPGRESAERHITCQDFAMWDMEN